jgi:hypothetical protein
MHDVCVFTVATYEINDNRKGLAVAQEGSRRILTAAARARSRFRPYAFVADTAAVFSEYFGLPPPNSHSTKCSILNNHPAIEAI